MADKPAKTFKPPSYLEASRLSRITQWYLNPLFREGYKRRLELEDIPEVLPWDASAHLGDLLEREWTREQKKAKPSFAFALLRIFRYQLFLHSVIAFFVECLKISQPLLINALLDYFQGRGVSRTMAYVYGMLLSLCGVIVAFPNAAGFQLSWCIGMRARAAGGALIFRKMMSLKMENLGETSSGSILNHMATDVEKFQMGAIMTPYVWLAPVELIVVSTLLFLEFGVAFIGGLATIFVLLVYQQVTSRLYGKLRLKIAKHSDKRTHLMKEIIAGMRVIKMYCWEVPYTEIIATIRKHEIRRGIEAGLFETLNIILNLMSTKIIAFVTIATHVMMGNVLTPQQIFKLVAWLEILKYALFFGLSAQMLVGNQAFFSARRVQTFLDTQQLEAREDHNRGTEEREGKGEPDDRGTEKDTSVSDHNELHQATGLDKENPVINLKDVTAVWKQQERPKSQPTVEMSEVEEPAFSLRNLNLGIHEGELVACVGPVGSGKSSLLLAILDQMPVTSGNVSKKGEVAYVPQEPWVFSGTFRENVLFGCSMDQRKYDETVAMCALGPDIDQMPSGDLSLVGERGLSLSGGQKARLNLARAVYRDSDLYLLDDPLSAVDTRVGKHLFEACIRGHLKDKTRILVTHQLQYLKRVDRIIVFKGGMIVASGSFKELESKVNFSDIMGKDDEKPSKTDKGCASRQQDTFSAHSISTSLSRRESLVPSLSDADTPVTVLSTEDAGQIEEEERLKGVVAFGVYRKYWEAGKGPLVFTLLCVLLAATKSLFILTDWWIADWANWFMNDYEKLYNVSNLADDFVAPESHDYLHVYAVLVAAFSLASIGQSVVFVIFTRLAAKNLHNRMFGIVMRAPLAFFERNPVGRVLNRFSRDTLFMDEILPQSAFVVMTFIMLTFAMVVFVSVVNPWVLLFTIPLAIIVIVLRQYGAHTTRHVKRIEALNRSPVYSHVTACLQGMSVIRAFNMEELMTKQFDHLQDRHTASWFAFLSCYRWLGVRFDWITGFYLTFTVFASLLLSEKLDGTLVGLSLTYIFSMLGVLQFVVRQTAEVESYMTSVERILQYTKLEQEAPPHIHDIPLPADWPNTGDITFENTSVAYIEESSLALDNISFAVQGGEKIGVVGRTGAGKSTLIAALMRLVEPRGSILIDSVDITKIGLDDLRRNISIIPQDPVLFTGTLRINLDPFSEYTDEQLWQAIDEVQLRERVEQMPGHLYGEIAEGGSNFSVGQKQLVCLARALLRQNKILLIDEATANVDLKTDDLIQQTLRTKFTDCTVFTVAHRLNTIIDCDKVLVLDKGKVAEFDHPFVLLQRNKGIFFEMVELTGRHYAHNLLTLAENKYNQVRSGEQLTSGNSELQCDDATEKDGDTSAKDKDCHDHSSGATDEKKEDLIKPEVDTIDSTEF